MKETIADKLAFVSQVLHWAGKYDEANAIAAFVSWLRANNIETREEAAELMECSNDNPNIANKPAK